MLGEASRALLFGDKREQDCCKVQVIVVNANMVLTLYAKNPDAIVFSLPMVEVARDDSLQISIDRLMQQYGIMVGNVEIIEPTHQDTLFVSTKQTFGQLVSGKTAKWSSEREIKQGILPKEVRMHILKALSISKTHACCTLL